MANEGKKITTSLEIEVEGENEKCPSTSLNFDIPFEVFIAALLISQCVDSE